MTKFIGVALVAAVLMVGAVGFLMLPITGGGRVQMGVKTGGDHFIMNKAYPTDGLKFIMYPSSGIAAYPTSGPRFPTNSRYPSSGTTATKLKIW